MQVGIGVKCMHTNFGGRGLSGFGDIATFKNCQISLFDLFSSLSLSLSQDVSLLTPEEVSDELGLSLHKLSFSQTLTLDGHFVADSNILDLLTAAIIKY